MAMFRVRLGGKYHDDDSYFDVANYILDLYKTPNHFVGGISDDPFAVAYQMQSLAQYFNKDEGVRIRHMIVAFSKEDRVYPSLAFEIAKKISEYYQSKYQIIYAVHEDHEAPHIHILMSMVNYNNGQKYDGSTKDYNNFLNHIMSVLFPHKVDLRVDNSEYDD